MGGIVDFVEHTVGGIAGRRNHEGSPLQHAMRIVPAAVSIATGNPLLTGIGAMMALGNSQTPSSPTAADLPPINVPTFEQLRLNAITKTQEAFDREGVYHLLNPFRRFNREIPPTDRDRFPSLKKTAKERAKKRIRNG